MAEKIARCTGSEESPVAFLSALAYGESDGAVRKLAVDSGADFLDHTVG